MKRNGREAQRERAMEAGDSTLGTRGEADYSQATVGILVD